MPKNETIGAEEKIPKAADYVKDHVFAIDFDPRITRISKMLNLIAGDGHSNVFSSTLLIFLGGMPKRTLIKPQRLSIKNFEKLEKKLPLAEQEKDDHKRSINILNLIKRSIFLSKINRCTRRLAVQQNPHAFLQEETISETKRKKMLERAEKLGLSSEEIAHIECFKKRK
ncbi:hypothetical protein [Helicobacter ailurogastricus]|uniref:hypothetical protein n=1 Tax=Helicobacter ailurogastricus TaxID=1578720 RepID=UPI0022C412CD|nr:hypothetical protein [Helicobacter ailurogastricus]GLH58629.1 hypothetical protein NHP214376_14240 [Helicobacter ailurogastricus]